MYLLDTNICIYFMKNSFPGLSERIFSHDPNVLMISAVTVFELEYGAAKSKWGERNRNRLAMFLAPFTILPFDSKDALEAGRIRYYLQQKGVPIGSYDLQIAAQGVARGLTVVTHNTSEFQRVPGIRLEDWMEI